MFKTYTTNDEKVAEFINEFTKVENEDDIDYYYEIYIESVKNLLDEKTIEAIVIDNKIVALFKIVKNFNNAYYKPDEVITDLFEGIICSLYYHYEYEESVMKLLTKTYPNHLLVYHDNMRYEYLQGTYNMLEVKFEEVMSDDFVETFNVIFEGDYLVSTNCSLNKETIIEQVKEQFQMEFDSIEVKKYHNDNDEEMNQLKKLFENELAVRSSSNTTRYLGFTYVSKQDLFGYRYSNIKNLIYFVVIGKKGTIKKPLGVLKIADYPITNAQYYMGLNYINTSSFFYKQGYSKLLYQALNEHILSFDHHVLFISSGLSNQGEKASIDKTRLKYVTAKNCQQFNSNSDYNNYLYDNRKNIV